jgi:hypothetical protein
LETTVLQAPVVAVEPVALIEHHSLVVTLDLPAEGLVYLVKDQVEQEVLATTTVLPPTQQVKVVQAEPQVVLVKGPADSMVAVADQQMRAVAEQ